MMIYDNIVTTRMSCSDETIITAVVCTHNPRKDYFSRTLAALGNQTLAPSRWKFIVADNASNPPVEKIFLQHCKQAGHLILEPKPGKVNAMVKVATEIEGDWVVFVDDDNVLNADFFEKLLELDVQYPNLGVLSANIIGEFECEVPQWAEPYLWLLAIRPLESPIWANIEAPHIGPIGAGMCVRKKVYDEFVRRYHTGSVSASHGRSGDSLAAGTDDTVFMGIAFDMGLGCGAFPDLRMTHLISKERLDLEYLVRLAKDMTISHTVLAGYRQASESQGPISLLRSIYHCCCLIGFATEKRAMELAFLRGRREGRRQIALSKTHLK